MEETPRNAKLCWLVGLSNPATLEAEVGRLPTQGQYVQLSEILAQIKFKNGLGIEVRGTALVWTARGFEFNLGERRGKEWRHHSHGK